MSRRKASVSLDDRQVTVVRPDGSRATVLWKQCGLVHIWNHGFGNVSVSLGGTNSAVSVPIKADGFPTLRQRLEQLDGFNKELFRSQLRFRFTSGRSELCWLCSDNLEESLDPNDELSLSGGDDEELFLNEADED